MKNLEDLLNQSKSNQGNNNPLKHQAKKILAPYAPQAQIEFCKRSYLHYCQYVHHGRWKPGRHHELICEKLQQIAEGNLRRLMIFMPPRSGKSMCVTETFPSYYLGRHPDKPVIEVSYGADLAHRFGKLNRRKVEEFGSQIFGIEISKEKSSMTEWDVSERLGGMLSVGVGGSITGKGGSLIIIDDPIKNREEAESETIRNKIWNEWQNTIYTRLQDDAAVIIILTRWHEDDLAGRLLNPEFSDPRDIDSWEILSLPAICEDPGDPLGRQPGQALWPEYGYDEVWAEQTKRMVGSQSWAALYQQRPAPAEGSLIKRNWWKFYSQLPGRFDEIIQSWDCAFKDTDTSDFVVGQVWGRIGADKYLIDQVRDRMDFPATIQAIRSLSAKHPRAATKLIEDKANGSAVIATLKHQISGLIPVNPEGGKVVRAQAITPEIEAGNVYLPSPSIAPWIHDFIEECASFPRGKHDDQVDAMSQGLARFTMRKTPQVRWL